MNPAYLTYLNKCRVRTGDYGTDDSDGFTGFFLIRPLHRRLKVIASDGLGWQHVSVSIPSAPRETPSWAEMAAIKDIFWPPDQAVIQIHPPAADYLNNHPGCLHLWRPTTGPEIPLPPSYMVGLPELNLA